MDSDILEMLYGDGAWEITKALTEKQQRTQARVGLATNAVGITAGTAAMGSEYKKFKAAGKPVAEAGKAVAAYKAPGRLRKIAQVVGEHPKAVAGAGLGLQALNLGGDMIANRVLARSAKPKVAKRHLTEISKIKMPGAGARQAYSDVKSTAANVAGATKNAEQITGKVNSFLTPKKLAFVGGGSLAALGGATAAGNYAGSRAGAKAGVKAGIAAGPTLRAPAPATKMVKPKPVAPVSKPQPVGKAVEWDLTFNISKADEDKKQVFGWASIVTKDGKPVADLQDDIMTIETIEKAAYEYVKKSRKGGNQHQRNGADPLHVSDMIESFVVTDEKKEQLGLPQDFPTGWIVGFQVNDDETWRQVKSGERPMFSLHGSGRRTERLMNEDGSYV